MPKITNIFTAFRGYNHSMAQQSTPKKDLHIRIHPEVYTKLKQFAFYERQTLSEIVNRSLIEFLEEKAIDEPEFVSPPIL